ncbi:MAG: HAD family hydrolase [Candidatus Marinimicrobia bacterium]|nr:HAD family hydrolase [Candidatus Neomarinimicrobiota bacterium]
MKSKKNLRVIGFDADDTLWINESYYLEAEEKFCHLVSEFANREEASRALFETEISNLNCYGYGIKAFTLSLLETAFKISRGLISADKLQKILSIAKEMIQKPVELLAGVEEVLKTLHEKGFELIVATKGDLLDQERKLEKSGIEKYFHHIEIMSEKKAENYQKLLNHLDIEPTQFLMIGNSVKSDVLPVLELGGHAIHVPFHTTWAHEQVNTTDLVSFPVVKNITETLNLVLNAED